MNDCIERATKEIVEATPEQLHGRVSAIIRTAHAPFREKVVRLVEAVEACLSGPANESHGRLEALEIALRAVKEAIG